MSAVAMRVGVRRAPMPALSDPWLLGVAAVLTALGLVMVASSSVSLADRGTGLPFYYLQRQLVFACAGVAAGYLVTWIPLRTWDRLGLVLLAAAFALLLLVLIPSAFSDCRHRSLRACCC